MGTQFSSGGSQYLHDALSRQPLPTPVSTPPVLMRLSDVRPGAASVGRFADTPLPQAFPVKNVGEAVPPDCRAGSSDSNDARQDSQEGTGNLRSSRHPSRGGVYPRIAAACVGVVILFLTMTTFWSPAADEVESQDTFPDFQMVDEGSKVVKLRSPVTDQPSDESPATTAKAYPQTVDLEVGAQAEPGIPLSPARPPAKNFKSITLGLPTRAAESSSLGSRSVQETPVTRFKTEPEPVEISGPRQLEDVVELRGSQGSSQSPSGDRNSSDSSVSGQPTVDWPQRKQRVLNNSHVGNEQMVTNTQDGNAGSTGTDYPQMHVAPPVPRYPVTRPTRQYFQPRPDGPRDPLRTSQRAVRRSTGSGPEPRHRGAQLQGWLENPPIERSDEPYRSSLY